MIERDKGNEEANETDEDFLRALDCTDIQGYFFSPTLPVEKYTEKLRAQSQKRT